MRRLAFSGTPITAGGIALGVAMSASGQLDTARAVDLGRIEVTGSNLRQVEGGSGLPVQIITRDELVNGGVQTAQELLERISANQSFGGYNEAGGVGTTLIGFTAASLRGLGSQRTLVLLNGRRLAPYALSGGQSMDLSGIPASALARVEILKDGASAIYGTDAIGGVINFILRQDYAGVELNANYFGTEQGGGNNGRVNATAGAGDLATDRYNVFVSADRFRQDPLQAAQRDSTKTTYLPGLGADRTSGFALPANIGQPGGFAGRRNPTIPARGTAPGSCLPPYSFPTQTRPLQCRFDIASVIETIPEADKTSVIGRLTWQFDPEHRIFAEGSWYRGNVTQRFSPTPVSGDISNTPMTLPPDSPHYPTAYVASLPGGNPDLPLQLHYRTVELGPRIDQAQAAQWNGVVGLRGAIGDGDYQVSANYTANRQTVDFGGGYVHESTFGPLLRSGAINPFGANTGAVLEQMRSTQVTGRANDNRAENFGGEFKLADTVYELPAGPVALALGVEGRRESLEQLNSDVVVGGDVLGGAGAIASLREVHRTVWSLYGELSIPIAKPLEASLAARYDHYSDFGGTTNPKVTLRWRPARDVLLRAAYGTGFRAPTLSDLFQPPIYGFTSDSFDDPVRCPVTQSESDCDTAFVSQGGGNPLLQPEKSRQVNAGLAVAPADGMSASVDYYWVEVKNLVQVLTADEILGGNYPRWAPAHVVRGPPDAHYPGLPGAIARVVENQINVGILRTSGIDVELKWRAAPVPIGRVALGLTGTYVIKYRQDGINSPLFPGAAGTRGPVGAIARWRHYATVDWSRGAWGTTLANTFQDGYSEVDLLTCNGDGVDCIGTRRVGSYSIWDLQTRYTGFRDLTLTLGIRNALDTPPPVSNQQAGAQAGIDPSYADPRGRMYYGAVRYAFR